MFRFLGKLVALVLSCVACFFAGHRWKVICTNIHRSGLFAGMHMMAGQDADCTRCGKQWRDAKFSPEVIAASQRLTAVRTRRLYGPNE